MTKLTKDERIDLVEEARTHLEEAIECLRQAFPNDGYVKAYLLDHLQIRVGGDHGFLSSDVNMDELIERIEDADGDEEE
jgi:hypothetical protein